MANLEEAQELLNKISIGTKLFANEMVLGGIKYAIARRYQFFSFGSR